MKKFFSLVLALVMALSLTTVAWGADPVAKIGTTEYDSLAAAVTHANAGDEIVLLKDVADGVGIVIDKKLTIDFGGYTYTFASSPVGSTGTETLGFQILESAVAVTLKNGTLTSKAGSGVKMLVQNYCDLTVEKMTLNGVNLDGGGKYVLSNNQGDVVIENTTITAAADGVAFDTCKYGSYTAPAVTVKGTSVINGTVEAAGGTLEVQSGTVNGDINVVPGGQTSDVVVKGGTFTDDVSPYLASTAGFVTNPDGSVSVGAKATTGTYDLYSCNNTAVAAATGLSYTKVAAAPKTDGTGTIAYVAVDNGKNYMEISSFEATKADFYVTVSGSKTAVMYLREVSTVSYVASAKEFTNFGYGCGQYTKAYGDTSKYYQVLDGAYKNRVFRAETTGLGFLVDGKIVQLATEVTLNAHTWSATAVDTVTGVPTKAICGKCSTTGTVYASAAKVPAAAVIDVTALSYNGVSYPVVAGYKTVAGPVTGTTDKVTSAETFDAGIAMYVGMSVMAAAGSAVVIGKKKD